MRNIYRAQPIGSLLRPQFLWDARKARDEKAISMAEFKRIEDRAVDHAIALQEGCGLDIVTDGEQRRISFIGPLSDVIEGLIPVRDATRTWHSAEKATVELPMGLVVAGKIRRRRSLVSEEFSYARARAARPLKVTLPSPLMLNMFWSESHSRAAYRDPFELFRDSVELVREEVRELAALGCEYIQIDAPELPPLVDPTARNALYESKGISPERMLSEGVELINAVADAPGVTFGLHMCRGNNRGHWLASGGYDTIANAVFKVARNFDEFLLEYDDARSGSFEPLKQVPRDKSVVLGLVSSKTNTIEPADSLIARIDEASRYFPREQMALSTQCGFNSGYRGNPIDAPTQEAKLRLVASVAHRVWR